MAFSFKFQSILDLKQRIEDQKKSKYGEANEELKNQKDKLNVLIEEREHQFDLMREKGKEGFTPKELIVYNNYMNRLKRSIEIQIVVVEKAKAAVEKARYTFSKRKPHQQNRHPNQLRKEYFSSV